MMFETEESGTRRYMGTITGISDLDPLRWKNSQWRNLQVGWDESTAGAKRTRVSVWEIEPVTAPFFICPPPFLRPKRPRLPGMPDYDSDLDCLFKRTMPWLGDDPHSLSNLSIMQWMNMQQNPSLGNPMQSNILNTLPGSVLQNLPAGELSRQLGFTAPQVPQQNNLQFNSQRPVQSVQQLEQLQKSSGGLNQLNSLIQSQQQLSDLSQLPRQNLIDQTLASSQVQSQLLQSQALVQNPNSRQQPSSLQNHQRQGNLSQILPQQQQQPVLGQNQQQGLQQTRLPDLANQQAQVTDGQIQLQILQRLQQQQQSLLSQQPTLQQANHINQFQDVSQMFSRSLPSSQMLDLPQTQMTTLAQSQIMSQQMTKSNSQANLQFCQQSHVPKLQQQNPVIMPEMLGQGGLTAMPMSNHLSTAGSCNLTGAAAVGQSAITDEIPSCSTSPSTNNGPSVAQTILNSNSHQSNAVGEGISQPSATILSSNGLGTVSANAYFVKELHQKADVKPSVNIAKIQNQGHLTRQTFHSISSSQMNYMDTSSATSASFSQNDIISQSNPLPNSQSILLGDTGHDVEVQADLRNNIHTIGNIEGHQGTSLVSDMLTKNIPGPDRNLTTNVTSGCLLGNYESTKDAQQELSSSMVTQSFGVPDIAFNSIDSAISDNSFVNRGGWAQPPQYQRMRTYTKVYKRGAVGRSIDVTRYSGYEELKQDLARMFGVEGQMEDRGRVGWKLVYVDHENDVLLVGDDPWEDFVNCVGCIKILSPQEVQQMSLELDGDFGNPSFTKSSLQQLRWWHWLCMTSYLLLIQ